MTADDRSRRYSYRVRAADVPSAGLDLAVNVAEADRAALAERLGLAALERMTITGTVRPWRRGGLRVDAVVGARVEQQCVVTLEPVWTEIEESFTATFLPSGRDRPATGPEIVFDAFEDDEPPEPMVDGAADVGAVAAEYLALAIDPYPRKPEARLEDEMPVGAAEESQEKQRPGTFEILQSLKTGSGDGDDH